MPRPARSFVPGGIYHLTVRGNDGGALFVAEPDRVRFVAQLRRTAERFRLRVHAWCLMTTHAHLVAETPDGRLSAAMHLLCSGYARAFNEAHGRRGHVFGERFRDTLVEDEAHLEQACRYVLENPVDAGIVRDPRAWPWSECRGLGFVYPRHDLVRGDG